MSTAPPWWARIAVKLVLSRLPAGYATWRRLNLFRHGAMHDTDYALGVFAQHFARSGLRVGKPFVAAELGPGDSLSSAVIAAAHGATHTYLVDAGAFATGDIAIYRAIAARLREKGLNAPDLAAVNDIAGVLQACRASYGTRGLESLRAIPTATVDFVWSHAVLEHVRRREFADSVGEMHRFLKPDGVGSHVVDLRDHLGGGLNNLRISSGWWEADWMAKSGFYTNRMSKSEILAAFAQARFDLEVVSELSWKTLPIAPSAIARELRDVPLNDRLTSVFDVITRPEQDR